MSVGAGTLATTPMHNLSPTHPPTWSCLLFCPGTLSSAGAEHDLHAQMRIGALLCVRAHLAPVVWQAAALVFQLPYWRSPKSMVVRACGLPRASVGAQGLSQ